MQSPCESDPQVDTLTANQWCVANAAGDAIDCTAAPPAGNTDTLASLSCNNNEVAQWNGSAWVCASVANSDTLNTLTCNTGEVAEFDGTNWICAVAS